MPFLCACMSVWKATSHKAAAVGGTDSDWWLCGMQLQHCRAEAGVRCVCVYFCAQLYKYRSVAVYTELTNKEA